MRRQCLISACRVLGVALWSTTVPVMVAAQTGHNCNAPFSAGIIANCGFEHSPPFNSWVVANPPGPLLPWTVLSAEPEAIRKPSGLAATENTRSS